ncbi:uncharacterized protein RCC_00372 [Ramularia collo-cygni]|uniref:Mtf2-like C-terminal domain-containing protein n=1 Tax=Ramularia collo-cygni TaxID=112498 RepID=A0A2D3UP10_9PEZI|nr:uncharacterized protein RCC_00372 [Ramularia collo-cygni]CZT14395.1 uncharacterized protein RCC_00372 [Ramularia collo-cygni]
MPRQLRISRSSPLESPLSFLYQTPTILRRSYASDAFGEIDTLELKRQARQKISADWSKVNRSPTRTRKSIKPIQSRPNRPVRSFEPPTHRRREVAPPALAEREWIDHVPFEGIPDRPATILDRLQGQTITRHEFNVFKNVLAQGSAESAAREAAVKKRKIQDSTGRAKGVVREKVEMPDLLKPLAEEAEAISAEKAKQEEEILVVEEEKRTKKYREGIQKMMDEATTDVELWNVWEGKLKMDVENVLAEPENDGSTEEKETVNLTTLTATLPQLLLRMSEIFREKFRGSGFSSALLPNLRNMGTRAFAMGATTSLFNAHMRCHFETYNDLDGVIRFLTEMDRDVYEFDEGTHQLLETIFERAERAAKQGGAVAMLWMTERKLRGLDELEKWETVVAERIGRAHARKKEWERGDRDEVGISVT